MYVCKGVYGWDFTFLGVKPAATPCSSCCPSGVGGEMCIWCPHIGQAHKHPHRTSCSPCDGEIYVTHPVRPIMETITLVKKRERDRLHRFEKGIDSV